MPAGKLHRESVSKHDVRARLVSARSERWTQTLTGLDGADKIEPQFEAIDRYLLRCGISEGVGTIARSTDRE